jgi:O-antigen/teichoic acid export membrane protein
MINGVLSGSLAARDKFLDLNVINAVGTILMAVMPLAAAVLIEPRLDLLVAASFAARTFSAVLLFTRCARAVPLQRPRLSARGDIVTLTKYGGWITVIGAVGPLLSLWDRFAIGVVLGAATISYYVVPFNLVMQATIVPASLSAALFPKLSGRGRDDVADTSREALRALSTVMTPLILVAAALLGPFLILWIGPELAAKSAPAGYILLAGIWANSLAQIPGAALLAHGRPDLVAKAHLSELLPYVALLYVCMKLFGVPGVALAWSIRSMSDAIILFVLSREPLRELRPLVLPLILVCGAVVTCLAFPLSSRARWIMLVSLALVGIVYALRTLPSSIAMHLERLPLIRRFASRRAG